MITLGHYCLLTFAQGDEALTLNLPKLSELEMGEGVTYYLDSIQARVSGIENLVTLEPSRDLYNKIGASYGTAEGAANIILKTAKLQEAVVKSANGDYFSFAAELATTLSDIDAEHHIHLKIQASADLHLVEALRLEGRGQMHVKRFCLKVGKIGATDVHWGRFESNGVEGFAVVTQGSSGIPKVVFSAPGKPGPSPVLELHPVNADGEIKNFKL